jgi:hypothetical protein
MASSSDGSFQDRNRGWGGWLPQLLERGDDFVSRAYRAGLQVLHRVEGRVVAVLR